MTKRLLSEGKVLRLLRQKVERSSQMGWARRMGLSRTYLNKVLHGRKPLPQSIAEALGLRKIVKCAASENKARALLLRAVERAGSISAWSRHTGIDRSVVSLVVNGKRSFSPPFFRALRIKRITGYVQQKVASR
jgi:DNA-binding transcriptional regulator YdaS (Cro superfamily)